MIVTILKVGEAPEPLRPRFASYPDMFRSMFKAVDAQFSIAEVDVIGGEALPTPDELDGVLVTGSAAGVYESHGWISEVRALIRALYARNVPLAGICYGHQAIADAMGGVVRKSERGWGLGRHTYRRADRPDIFGAVAPMMSVTCSHQDQVVVPPPAAEVILSSPFAPNAGLAYANGRALSFQPHPEFDDDYGRALTEMRRGVAPDATVEIALASFSKPSDRLVLAGALARFFERAGHDAPGKTAFRS